MPNPKVTFIIPTVGRSSLTRTLRSLVNQSDPDWEAIVVLDGVWIEQPIVRDNRLLYLCLPESIGNRNKNGNGGLVRNEGLKIASSPWIGFVDDDDRLTTDYVETLCAYTAMEPLDVVVFRMLRGSEVIPAPHQTKLEQGKVGISYAVRLKFIEDNNIRFINGDVEDYHFLRQCMDRNCRWKLVPNLTYLVG